MDPTKGYVISCRKRRRFPIAVKGQVLTDIKPDPGVCTEPLQRCLHNGRPRNRVGPVGYFPGGSTVEAGKLDFRGFATNAAYDARANRSDLLNR